LFKVEELDFITTILGNVRTALLIQKGMLLFLWILKVQVKSLAQSSEAMRVGAWTQLPTPRDSQGADRLA
jgi:hypothetical protein